MTINLNHIDPIDRPYRRSLFISPHYLKKLKKIFDDKYASSARIYTPNAAGSDLFTLSVRLLLRYKMKFAAKISTRSGMHHNPKNRISNIFS